MVRDVVADAGLPAPQTPMIETLGLLVLSPLIVLSQLLAAGVVWFTGADGGELAMAETRALAISHASTHRIAYRRHRPASSEGGPRWLQLRSNRVCAPD